MRTKLFGILAVLGLAAITIGLPWLLLAIGDVAAPRLGWSLPGLWQALTSPDDGTLALSVIKAAGWIAWVILTVAIGLELTARLRRIPTRRLPGFRLPQTFARRLVGAAAALFVATATISVAAPSVATPTPTQTPAPSQTHSATPRQAPAHHQASAHKDKPAKADRKASYTVKQGDTLSEIALEHTGKASNYPKIFRASKQITQPGGRHLVDADEIDVGWKLTIPGDNHTSDHRPGHTKKTVGSTPAKTSTSPTPKRAKPDSPASTAASPAASAIPTAVPSVAQTNAPAGSAPAAPVEKQADSVSPVWVLSGLAGAGSLLAGALWVALRRRRAHQFRSRRPGRTISAPAPVLSAVEKTMIREGAPTGELVLFIDEVLRRLAGHFLVAATPLPSLVGLDVAPDQLTLRFRRPAQLPDPFTAVDGQVWLIDRSAELDQLGPLSADGAAPWPQLVTMGADAAGWRLVNLEALGVVSLTGNQLYAEDLARYLVGELAVAPWARDVEVDCLAVCGELPGLAPARIHYHPDTDVVADLVAAAVATVDRLTETDALNLDTARAGFAGDELWDSRVLVSAIPDAQHIDVLTRLVAEQPGRNATSVLLLAVDLAPVGLELRLTDQGRLQVPALELDLVVNGLTEAEARGCVAVLAAGADLHDLAMPTVQPAEGSPEWEQWCDQAGSLRTELTVPRGSDVTGTTSMLPEPDQVYVSGTANTAEDLAVIAPQVPITVRERVEQVDPTLDADITMWWASSADQPRLQVLGQVKVRLGRTGQAIKAAARTGFATELVAYLHTRPTGATTEEVADALAVSVERVRKDASLVRGWLGANPATGEPFLPPALKAGRQRGVGVYLIEDLLCDADLFRRLRLRGEARGADGLDDLTMALRLVNGTPYDGIRAKGGVWLAENPLDQHLLCAVVDVAHTVTTIALANGQLQQARAAAELAALTAPDETTPQLDLAAIANQEGDPGRAAIIATAMVSGRTAGEPRSDLSERAEAILRSHRWLEQASRAS